MLQENLKKKRKKEKQFTQRNPFEKLKDILGLGTWEHAPKETVPVRLQECHLARARAAASRFASNPKKTYKKRKG